MSKSKSKIRAFNKSEITRIETYMKTPSCPECDSDPPVCTQKTEEHIFYRCRECGHKWRVECHSRPGQRLDKR